MDHLVETIARAVLGIKNTPQGGAYWKDMQGTNGGIAAIEDASRYIDTIEHAGYSIERNDAAHDEPNWMEDDDPHCPECGQEWTGTL